MAAVGNARVDTIEADHIEDHDSTLGEDESTYTQSLRSSLLTSVSENGRGYHKYKDGQYMLPEDEKEQERLDMQHTMLLKLFGGKLILAPVKGEELLHALDLGTGTGIWAIDFADVHPNCQVLGIDLSPTQPSFVPPNCKFEVDDYESEWTFKQKFNLVHGRMMLTSIERPEELFKNTYDSLAPGGWFELQDLYMPIPSDDGTTEGTTWDDWNNGLESAIQRIGRDIRLPARYEGLMTQTGFVNVEQRIYKLPVNTWPKDKFLKELGAWNLINMVDGLEGYTVRLFTKVLGMSIEDVEVLMMKLRKDCHNKKIHAYWPIYVVYGQKPF